MVQLSIVMSDYEITDKDVEAVVRYLEIYHSENANEDFAIKLLEATKAGIHQVALSDPDQLEDLYAKVIQSADNDA